MAFVKSPSLVALLMSLVATLQSVSACTYAQAAGRGINNLCDNQIKNAKIIMEVARNNGFGRRGKVVALAAALVESRLVNVQFGDSDSIGLFQQRCSVGWCRCGADSQCGMPYKAARAFFGVASYTSNPGLGDITSWQDMTISQAAQAVQRSCCPERYGQQADLARAIVDKYGP